MNTIAHVNKEGGVLLMVMVVMIAFTILSMGLFKLSQGDGVETVYVEHHSRAFWMAEAGLEKALDLLQTDEDFRTAPGGYLPISVNFNEGTIPNESYKIASITTASVGASGSVYTVTAVGYAGNLNRRIQQTVFVAPGGDNMFRSKNGDIEISSNDHIEGNIFADNGNLTIDAKENLNSQNNPTGVDGYVVMGGGSIDGKGAFSVDVIETAIPPEPSIDMAFWQPFLDGATNNANTNGIAGVSLINITTGITNYNATAMTSANNLVISGTASGPLGFHYLVSNSGIQFSQWPELKSQTILVVDGNVRFAQNVTFQDNCVVFATGDIYVAQSSDAGGSGVTLIARGNITFAQNMVFHGIVYADGDVDIGQNAQIVGAILAGGDITLGSNVDAKFDKNVFLNPLPGLINVASEANLEPMQWTEIAPEP